MPKSIHHALDHCMAMIKNNHTSIEDCLAVYPEHENKLRELLMLTQSIKKLPEINPDPSFVKNASQSLIEKLPPLPVTFLESFRLILQRNIHKPIRRFSMTQVLITLITLIALTTGGIFGVDASGPGDIFYGLEKAIEQIQLAVTTDPEAITELRLGFAKERLQEVIDKLNTEDSDNALVALEGYENEIAEIAKLIANSEGFQQEQLKLLLQQALVIHTEILTNVLDEVPEEAQAAIMHALEVSLPSINLPFFTPEDTQPGKPDDLPSGKPEDIPSGPPSNIPGNILDEVPAGSPDETPEGRPNWVPSGTSEIVPPNDNIAPPVNNPGGRP